MNRYKRFFPRHNSLIAVVHAEYPVQALRNARIAFEEGADGIFLINHRIAATSLNSCYDTVRDAYRLKWIGLNWLDLTPIEGLHMMRPSMNGMWIDNAGVREDNRGDADARRVAKTRRTWEEKQHASFLLFGGVAFKYQSPVSDLARVSKLAMPHVDVITTSGARTGSPPDIDKIRAIRQAIGNEFPLAVASGITPKNVREYMPYVNCFVVATGISESRTGEFNPTLVRSFALTLS